MTPQQNAVLDAIEKALNLRAGAAWLDVTNEGVVVHVDEDPDPVVVIPTGESRPWWEDPVPGLED